MMIATKCPSPEELRALSTGRLADQRCDDLLEHIRECETCRSGLETVADAEDSLIASLRSPDPLPAFDAEPDCKVAVLKALGTLASAYESPAGTDLEYLPKTIGEYEIVRPLGRGGMGSVVLARHTKLGREVALKVLAGHRLADARMRKRFEAEMRAVGKLSHPNVVTAYDAREVDGTAVLVTEYIDGFDLGQLLQRTGPLGTADACEIGRQVAVAIAYTSQQGFVHRDVKPSNIMLSRNGEVKLLDLGLARLQFEGLDQVGITANGQTMGTADYVAPEQVTDSRSVDARADIYSLGCTLFKLLTDAAPFADADHATAFAKMTAHVSQDPPSLAERLPDAPASLVNLVDSMLAKDPAKRPRSPQAVAEKLGSFTNGCDLRRLVARAETRELTELHADGAPNPASATDRRTLPLLRRRIPMWVLLGGGIAGLLLGLCLGILIKIEYPDGTFLRIPLPAGSKVTLEDSQTAVASDPFEPFQGLWRVATVEAGGQEIEDLQPLVWAFDQTTYYTCEAHFPQSGGTFWVSEEGPHKSIDFRDELKREERLPVGGGVYRMRSDGRLEFHSDQARQGARPSGFDIKDPPATLVVVTLERLGDLPRTPAEARAMTDGKDVKLSQAIMTMVDLVQVRPKFLEPPTREQRDAFALQQIARNKLKAIGVAFHQFHETYKKFPGSSNTREGANRTAPEGQIHPFSWRVAILPFIGENELYKQYRFHEPWDSEHNQALLYMMPAVYRSPYWYEPGPIRPASEAYYQGFAGEQTALGTLDGFPLHEFTDGTSPTLLIVETRSTVPWTKPQDIPFEKPEDAKRAIPFENTPLNFLTADGAVHSMEPVDWEKLPKLITRNGGERVEF